MLVSRYYYDHDNSANDDDHDDWNVSDIFDYVGILVARTLMIVIMMMMVVRRMIMMMIAIMKMMMMMMMLMMMMIAIMIMTKYCNEIFSVAMDADELVYKYILDLLPQY